jgi:hypothetical protein
MMAATPSEIKAELLIRFPGSEQTTAIGTVTIPLKIVPAGDGFATVTPDLSVFERMAEA